MSQLNQHRMVCSVRTFQRNSQADLQTKESTGQTYFSSQNVRIWKLPLAPAWKELLQNPHHSFFFYNILPQMQWALVHGTACPSPFATVPTSQGHPQPDSPGLSMDDLHPLGRWQRGIAGHEHWGNLGLAGTMAVDRGCRAAGGYDAREDTVKEKWSTGIRSNFPYMPFLTVDQCTTPRLFVHKTGDVPTPLPPLSSPYTEICRLV